MTRIGFLLLMTGVLALGLVSGCYTMIRHPGTDVAAEDSTDKTCLDCHTDSDYYHWTDPYYTAFYPYNAGSWRDYYGHPWWYDDFWYRVPGSPGGVPVELGGRHGWDRGPGAPVYIPSVGGTQVTPATTSGPKETTAAPQDTTRSPRPSRDTEEPKRRGWGR